jgi:HD-GYP domain-containing protein (c-di-GMP phosphodiesterase class II)
LSGDEIPLETRVMTVADIFDALTADRPYRAGMPVADALAILEKDVGTAVDAACLAGLKGALAQLERSGQQPPLAQAA